MMRTNRAIGHEWYVVSLGAAVFAVATWVLIEPNLFSLVAIVAALIFARRGWRLVRTPDDPPWRDDLLLPREDDQPPQPPEA
jgi:hypothetical protein